MKSDKEKLMDYLYSEMKEDERKAFEEELRLNPELQKELEALQGTRSMMQEWTDESPAQQAFLGKETTLKPFYKRVDLYKLSIAASFLLFALVISFKGFEFSYSGNDGLKLALGGFTNPEKEKLRYDELINGNKATNAEGKISDVKASLNPSEIRQINDLLNERNEQNMKSLVTFLSRSQDKQMDKTLKVFAQYLDEQRKDDIIRIGTEMEKIKRTSDNKFYETDLALNKLFQSVQYANR